MDNNYDGTMTLMKNYSEVDHLDYPGYYYGYDGATPTAAADYGDADYDDADYGAADYGDADYYGGDYDYDELLL